MNVMYTSGQRWFEQQHARRAYHVVDAFEHELCSYTGSPYAVAVNSCTNAILLALTWERKQRTIIAYNPVLELPRRTYIGVLQSALNAGWDVEWHDDPWYERYLLRGTSVVDSARFLSVGMYEGAPPGAPVYCLSFHSAKQLPLGRGGAILTDDGDAAEWFRAARMDGRPPGKDTPVFPGYHCPMPPDVAARGLDVLSRWNDKGYSPPPLPHEDYPDLSQWWPR